MQNLQTKNPELYNEVLNEMKERFDFIISLFNERPDLIEVLKTRTYIAGGAIRSSILSEKINDIDVFFYDQESLDYFLNKLETEIQFNLPEKWSLKETVNSYSFYYENSIYPTIQFIKLHVEMPSTMIREFDFTCNMNYYIPSSRYLYVEDVDSIMKKLLLVNESNCSIVNTFYRIFKFLDQGWGLNGKSLATMTMLLTRLDEIHSVEEVQQHLLMGMSQVSFNLGGENEEV